LGMPSLRLISDMFKPRAEWSRHSRIATTLAVDR
jgi:hypothetical protein